MILQLMHCYTQGAAELVDLQMNHTVFSGIAYMQLGRYGIAVCSHLSCHAIHRIDNVQRKVHDVQSDTEAVAE